MSNYTRGILAAVVTWPLAYVMFNAMEDRTRIVVSTALALGLGVFAGLFLDSSKNKS